MESELKKIKMEIRIMSSIKEIEKHVNKVKEIYKRIESSSIKQCPHCLGKLDINDKQYDYCPYCYKEWRQLLNY